MENKTVEHTLNKVVFLDRDGTLNEEVNYLHKTGDMKLLPGVPQALKKLKDAGYKLIVVTNQAGVARGYYTEEDVKILHQYMNQLLEKEGAEIDAFIIALIIRYMVSVHTKKCVIAANREPACLKWQKRIFRWTGLLPI